VPIYAYQCDDCGVRFERRQSFEDEPIEVCPECDGHAHRLIQPAGIVFKGSGFYVTDNRSSSRSNLASSNKKDESKSDAKEKSSTKETSSASSESKSD
jgi:putative FmdB family regulatory protein